MKSNALKKQNNGAEQQYRKKSKKEENKTEPKQKNNTWQIWKNIDYYTLLYKKGLGKTSQHTE